MRTRRHVAFILQVFPFVGGADKRFFSVKREQMLKNKAYTIGAFGFRYSPLIFVSAGVHHRSYRELKK